MRGPRLASMAWRNLWRNRRRTVITLSSLAFGCLCAVMFTGLSDWRWAEVINEAARMGAGHITLQHPGYLDAPSLQKTVHAGADLLARTRADPAVTRVAPRISGQLMLATASQTTGAYFVAIDPAREDEQTFAFLKGMHAGGFFATSHDKGIILGTRLAENLGAALGRKVVYTLTDKRGQIVSGLARVSGIIKTGVPSVDASLCLLPLDTIRETLGYDADEATQVALFVRDHRQADAVSVRLAALAAPAVAVPWQQNQPELAAFIAVKVASMAVLELLMLVLIGAGIFNTLFVSVMERLREFGILMAIGFSPGRLFRLVVWESFWLALVGIAAGALVTAVPYYLMDTYGLDLSAMTGGAKIEVAGAAMDAIFHVAIYPLHAFEIALTIVAATVVSGLYPAFRAGRVAPVDSLKLV